MRRLARRIAALGGVHADASSGDVVDDPRQYGQSVDLLVIGSHKYGPTDRVLEESISQLLADEPSWPLLVLAARWNAELVAAAVNGHQEGRDAG